MFLRLGIYSCYISGSSDLVGLLPALWKRYQSSFCVTDKTVMIKLERAEIDVGEKRPDGWTGQETDGNRQVIYTRKGKTILALHSCSPMEVTVYVQKALDSYVRTGVFYGLLLSLYRSSIGLHGVTLLCGNEVIILSAPSGTGKTTLAHLLETYSDAEVINGDFALLTPTLQGVFFEPTPFCGTSGRCLNHRVRVSRVVFLEQSPTNTWRDLAGREAMLRILDNAFVPTWDKRMQQAIQENTLKCVSMLKVNAFSFAPVKEAAEMFFNQL